MLNEIGSALLIQYTTLGKDCVPEYQSNGKVVLYCYWQGSANSSANQVISALSVLH